MTSGLWHDHPATPRQEQLAFKPGRKRARLTQAEAILELLREKRALGQPLELPEIMRIGIAQHSARFNELRRRGFDIQNETERASDGRILSRYYLRHDPEQDSERQP